MESSQQRGFAGSMIEAPQDEFDRDFAVTRSSRFRWGLPVVILLVAIAAGSAAALELYGGGFSPAPAAARQDAFSELAPIVKDLVTSQEQEVDQLQVLQQDLAAQKAETKRLSDQLAALGGKFDALQHSFASAPVPPVAKAVAPARKKPAPPPPAPTGTPPGAFAR
jgi:uncharacterized coiled-coil protein SlyX